MNKVGICELTAPYIKVDVITSSRVAPQDNFLSRHLAMGRDFLFFVPNILKEDNHYVTETDPLQNLH